MTGDSDGAVDPAVQALRDRRLNAPELLRARARPIATLLATASGVLVAGVTFSSSNPAAALSTPTRLWGGIAAGLFVISTCFYVGAALGRKQAQGDGGANDPALLQAADEIASLIKWFLRWGGRFGAASAAALIGAMIASFVTPFDLSVVTLQAPERPTQDQIATRDQSRLLCPELPDRFDAVVPDRDLLSGSSILQVRPIGTWCAGGTLYLPRQGVGVLLERP